MKMIERKPPQDRDLRPERLVRDHLQANPAASAPDVVLWLREHGIEMSVELAGSILAAIKTG